MSQTSNKLKPCMLDVWTIEPSGRSDCDYLVFKVEDDLDGVKAMRHAMNVLETQWDQAENISELNISVNLRRETMNAEDFPYDA